MRRVRGRSRCFQLRGRHPMRPWPAAFSRSFERTLTGCGGRRRELTASDQQPRAHRGEDEDHSDCQEPAQAGALLGAHVVGVRKVVHARNDRDVSPRRTSSFGGSRRPVRIADAGPLRMWDEWGPAGASWRLKRLRLLLLLLLRPRALGPGDRLVEQGQQSGAGGRHQQDQHYRQHAPQSLRPPRAMPGVRICQSKASGVRVDEEHERR